MNKYILQLSDNTSELFVTLSSYQNESQLFQSLDKNKNGVMVQRLEQREKGSRASMGTLTTGWEWRVHWSLLLQGVGVVTTSGPMERAGETRKSGSLFCVMAPAYLLRMYREATYHP